MRNVGRLHTLRVLRIVALHRQGYSRFEIAEKAKVKPGTVRGLLYRIKTGTYKFQRRYIKVRDAKIIALRQEGITRDQIGARLKVSKYVVEKRIQAIREGRS